MPKNQHMPHNMVEVALSRYYVPENLKSLILDYYNDIRLRVSCRMPTSQWHRLERGIITDCIVSVALFAIAMKMIVKSTEAECRGPLSKSGYRQPLIRAFIDDLTVTTTSVPRCRS